VSGYPPWEIDRILRNCTLEQLAGFAVEEREAEMGGTLAQAVKDADTVLGIVGGGAGILVHQALPEGAMYQDRQLAGGGRDGFGLAHSVGQAPIEGAEGRVGAAEEVHGRHAQDRGGAVGGRLRLGAEQAAAGDFVVGRQGEPGREVFLGGPAAHVGADLGEPPQGAVGADGIDPGEVDAGQLVERGANLEPRLIARGVFRVRGAGKGPEGAGAWAASVRTCTSIAAWPATSCP
jgi:hypothetical protein